MPTIGSAWRQVRDRFAAAGLETPALDARLLAGKVLGRDHAALAADGHDKITAEQLKGLESLAARRLEGEPVARILGEKEFYGLIFGLNPATLVPRPETELLVDIGLERLKSHHAPRILDMGTGSGCIVIALLAHLPNARAVAIDLSQEALAQAEVNARQHGVMDRLTLQPGSWFDSLTLGDGFDFIVSNPPYIEKDAIAHLDGEVQKHDPMLALDGGPDGLVPYREIADNAMAHLLPDGAVCVEVGYNQAAAVTDLLRASGFNRVETHHDLAGIERALLAMG